MGTPSVITPNFARTFVVALALLAGSSWATDDEPRMVEKWECRDYPPIREDVLITLWREPGTSAGFGRLRFAGVFFFSSFSLDGLTLRWDWDLDEGGRWDYTFMISPDGTGRYFDFSNVESGGSTTSSDLYSCKMAGEEVMSPQVALDWAQWWLPLVLENTEEE